MILVDRQFCVEGDRAGTISSRTQLITQNSGLQALSSKKSAKNQCVINSVQLLIEDMTTYVRWYSYRWLIERYHYVLKSGCGIEKLQLETAKSLEMALAK